MKVNLANVIVEHRAIRRDAITLHLPYPPSTNSLFANVPGKGRIGTRLYEAWKLEAGMMITAAGRPRLNGPVEISMTFQEKPGRHDLDNLAKAVCDLCVDMRVIDGDDSKTVRRIMLQWGNERGATVRIEPALIVRSAAA